MKSRVSLFPYLIWMILFIIIPLGLVAYFAFTTSNGEFTIENVEQVAEYTTVFIRSIFFAVIATLLCLLIGYPLAYIISRKTDASQRMMLMLIMLPMWMNFLLRTYAWMTILEGSGIINTLLKAMGFQPLNLINTAGAVILGMVYNYLPFMVLPLYSIMTKIENTTIEAAQDLGASNLNVFLKILFPLSLPGIVTGIVMVFVPAVSTFIISKMLGGGTNMMIGDLIEMQFLGNAYNPNLGSAISFVLMIIILICMAVFNKMDDEEKEGMII
ncbi:MAG TPA: ABC transporter permease [Ruminococcaceae bacterium]|nr:ABC transporter permease [Oscillospiraceae bacterium]